MSAAAGRENLRRAFLASVAQAQPGPALRRVCTRRGEYLEIGSETIRLADFEHVRVVGAGKAAPQLATALLELVGDFLSEISVTTRHGHGTGSAFDLWEAGHPIPDVGSLAGSADALRVCRLAGPNDLVFCLLTGGASSLWSAPPAGVTLEDLRTLTSDLLRSGARIAEINCVRKHLSRIAGGQLSAVAAPARVVTLAISDVIGSRLDTIGSGPTVPDPTTFGEALSILSACGVSAPSSVMAHLQRGAAGEIPETPKALGPNRTDMYVIADIHDALDGAAAELRLQGYQVVTLPLAAEGDAAETGRMIAQEAIRRAAESPDRIALLWGGESSVRVTGVGSGGRNQEMVVAAACQLAGSSGIMVGCFATDGSDGPTSAAGGFGDGATVQRAAAVGMNVGEMLRQNDSHTILSALGDLIVTGPTGTNVNDIAIALVG